MWYLFLQIWVWLVIAFVLGWIAHWFFCCRGKQTESAAKPQAQTVVTPTPAPETQVDVAPVEETSAKPLGFASPPAKVDDLKRIKGIGAVIEQTLNELGVYQFSQIADWDDKTVAWVEESLSFPGRIEREQWISQAKTLAGGGTTEFANRVDKGDVDYKGE